MTQFYNGVRQGGCYTRICLVLLVSHGFHDPDQYFTIHFHQNPDPDHAILTAGLLGEQYIGLLPGFIDESVETLVAGDFIEDTKPALVLEELIGQFLFSQGSDD